MDCRAIVLADARTLVDLAASLEDADLSESVAGFVRAAVSIGTHDHPVEGWRVQVDSLLDDLDRRQRALRRPWSELREHLADRWTHLDPRTRSSWLRSLELAWYRQRQGQAAVDEAVTIVEAIRERVVAITTSA